MFLILDRTWQAVARLHVQGAAGTEVQLRFAEVLNADGTIYTENLRTAKATDRYILSGKGAEDYQPLFTFHGYRYVELTGLNSRPAIGSVTAIVFHTDAPFDVQLHTGNAMVNHLWSNILWGQRSNFVGVPTDCPQRDERLGWTADAQVSGERRRTTWISRSSRRNSRKIFAARRWARPCMASSRPELRHRIQAMVRDGAMPVS